MSDPVFMRSCVIALAVAGCGSPQAKDPIPADTFCYTVMAQQTCIPADQVKTQRTVESGNVWFKIDTQVELPWHDDFGNPTTQAFPLSFTAQLPDGVQLPRPADTATLSIPLLGHCKHIRPESPFGGCAVEDAAAVCQAQSRYEARSLTVNVYALSATEVEAELAGSLDVQLPDACCENLIMTCQQPPPDPMFLPAGPYDVQLQVHAHF